MFKKVNIVKKLLFFLLSTLAVTVYADGDTVTKAEDDEDLSVAGTYINRNAYIQNPYIGMPSLGGTQTITESSVLNQSLAEKLFTDGTWNVIGEASYVNVQGADNYGYGANIFAQTGQIAGFSFGGLLTVVNPVLSGQINPGNPNLRAQGLPINQQITPQELFAEYQYKKIVQVDAGYIGINNSPFLTYYQNNTLNVVTYQGASVNIHPGNGWLLTALSFNGAQLLGENGFSQQTLYNGDFDNSTLTPNLLNHGSSSTNAIGALYNNSDNSFGIRLWAYQFNDYANLLYADSNLKLSANKDLSFGIGLQAAIEGGTTDNVFYNYGYGPVQSNMVGLQLSMNYDWFGVQLGYNNIWGPSNAYAGGDMVSPYTYQYASDPLFTTSWTQGLLEKSAGYAYKIAVPLTFLSNNLTISPSYANYVTTTYPTSAEYDLTMSYSIPQVKGLTVFAGYGYITVSDPTIGNAYTGQVMLTYLY